VAHPTPLTRTGTEPNRGGREAVAAAMGRLLDDGQQFAAPDAELDPEELRSWARRLHELARDLADCVEAPARNRVMEVLASTRVSDETNALLALLIDVAGASYEQLGIEVGLSGRTIERIEDGDGCRVKAAKKLATASRCDHPSSSTPRAPPVRPSSAALSVSYARSC
jgi:hypothetical protein